MRALTIARHGGLDELTVREDVPEPPLATPTDVRVRVRAAALNRLDLWVLGGIPGVTITPPWVVGSDGAGEVESVGSAVTRVRPGDRVILNPGRGCGACEYCDRGDAPLCPRFRILGEHVPGTIAEFVVVDERMVRRAPAGVSWAEAAAFPLATLTAYRMVETRARVRAGEDVLIWGIGGGVALAALQLCTAIGARAWVTSSSDAKLARAAAMGAAVLLNHARVDVAREVRSRTAKRGMDVVIDSVGTATWEHSLGALGRAGRLVTCGGTSGAELRLDVRRLFWNQWTIMGSTMGTDAEFDVIAARFASGVLRPPVDSTWTMAQGREAYARLQSGAQFGKVVVLIDG